jgi:hypothetical protein
MAHQQLATESKTVTVEVTPNTTVASSTTDQKIAEADNIIKSINERVEKKKFVHFNKISEIPPFTENDLDNQPGENGDDADRRIVKYFRVFRSVANKEIEQYKNSITRLENELDNLMKTTSLLTSESDDVRKENHRLKSELEKFKSHGKEIQHPPIVHVPLTRAERRAAETSNKVKEEDTKIHTEERADGTKVTFQQTYKVTRDGRSSYVPVLTHGIANTFVSTPEHMPQKTLGYVEEIKDNTEHVIYAPTNYTTTNYGAPTTYPVNPPYNQTYIPPANQSYNQTYIPPANSQYNQNYNQPYTQPYNQPMSNQYYPVEGAPVVQRNSVLTPYKVVPTKLYSDNATQYQLIDIVRDYQRKHPEIIQLQDHELQGMSVYALRALLDQYVKGV